MRTIWIVLAVILIVGASLVVIGMKSAEAPTETALNTTSEAPTGILNLMTLKLTSTAFDADGSIPSVYTCDGENKIPPLAISDVPVGTRSLVLIMDDPDIPDSVKQSRGIDTFDHWVVFNIPPETTEIVEGEEPEAVLGNNSAGKPGYYGPCPPDREHRYFFKLYALDSTLSLPGGSTRAEVEAAMEGHILGQTELIGTYNRK